MTVPGDEWWDSDLADMGHSDPPAVDFRPVEPLVLYGPDGDTLAEVWPEIGYRAP